MDSAFRTLPPVHRLLDEPALATYIDVLGASAVKAVVNETLSGARRDIAAGTLPPIAYDALLERIAERLANEEAAGLMPVINGTGILLHTNLGRAPLAAEALAAIAAIGGSYSNLEFDLVNGSRGSRYARVSGLIEELTGCEDALVVNNCAAAVLLVLDTFAKARDVIVSRNQLVEIGGGFRLPEVVTRSGARLVEVGTTNRVYLRDFEDALTPTTALLMRSHASNYRIEGFVADVEPAEIAALGRRAGVRTLEDLGSGALIDLAPYGLPHERTVAEALADGIEVVTFSGDKLLGGPQAGIIAGKRDAIMHLRANPLLRALRVDKATLAALAATLRLYTEPDGVERIPLYAMLAVDVVTLRARADRILGDLGLGPLEARIVDTTASVGGGAAPLAPIASAGIAVRPPGHDPDAVAARLRRLRPPIVGRTKGGEFHLDLRAVSAADDSRIVAALRREFAS